MLEQFLQTLFQDLEMEELPKKEEGGVYPLALNPQVTIAIRELNPGMSFFSRIGPCPEVKREELFIALMKANFLGQGTGGAAIAMDETQNYLTLSSVLPYDMSYRMFRDALEDFTNYLYFYREELIAHQKAAENHSL